jgi:hypothetical protein
MAFEKEGNDAQFSALGTATLYINENAVGELSIKTQPGKFTIGGEGVNIGKDPGGSVAKSVYEAPYPFVGGTIKEVIVDVSGNQYVDLELEALATGIAVVSNLSWAQIQPQQGLIGALLAVLVIYGLAVYGEE